MGECIVRWNSEVEMEVERWKIVGLTRGCEEGSVRLRKLVRLL